MKKLHVKLLQQRKAANKRACLHYRKSEGKPYSTHHYTEDRDLHWCDITFKRGKKVYNCTFLGLSAVLDDAVGERMFKHPEYDSLPQRNSILGSVPRYEAMIALEERIHKEGVLAKTGVEIRKDYKYGTGLIVSFPKLTFTEQDILDFISTWDGANKSWGVFNSKDYPYSADVYANAVKS